MKWFNLILRLLLGGVFVVAGVMKIGDPAGFAKDISNYRLLPTAGINLLAITLPWIEAVAGGLLMAGVWKRANALLISVLMVVFLVAIGQAVARDLNIQCGCFGSIEGRKVGLIALGQDAGLLLAALWLTWHSPDER